MKLILSFYLVYFTSIVSVYGQSNNDISKILQECIDHEYMEQFYQIDKYPLRVPLIILNDSIIPYDLELIKFGKSVRIITKGLAFQLGYHSIKRCPFEIKKFDINSKIALVEFDYMGAALRIRFKLTKTGEIWKITKVK